MNGRAGKAQAESSAGTSCPAASRPLPNDTVSGSAVGVSRYTDTLNGPVQDAYWKGTGSPSAVWTVRPLTAPCRSSPPGTENVRSTVVQPS